MAIERLSFGSESQYNAIELAIHLARYSSAQNLCRGLDVLDVACGEGYGSYAMAKLWGAKSVVGVDISEEAISTAQSLFSAPEIEYVTSPAENIDELFKPHRFDLVISLETIEHVNDPEKFLKAIRKVLKPDGIIILSCPNDHWYYGPGESGNPFHLRTYYFDEFRQQVELSLGAASFYLFGRPLNGFGNFLLSPASGDSPAKGMVEELNESRSIRVNQINTDQPISAEDCSYFVGIWSNSPIEPEKLISSAFFPISMNRFSITLEDFKPRLEAAEKYNEELQAVFHNSQTRIAELDKWTTELQSALGTSQKLAKRFESDLNKATELVELKQQEIYERQAEVKDLRSEIENLQTEIENWLQQLEDSKSTIQIMEASRFWKLRNQWFKLRDSLPANRK